jgi:hypothetical protein
MSKLASTLKNAIDRFLNEMPPYWKRDAVEKLLGDVQSEAVSDALQTLANQGVIHLTKRDECYFILTEAYLANHLPNEFVKSGITSVREMLSKYAPE